jgi:hypothetical protein
VYCTAFWEDYNENNFSQEKRGNATIDSHLLAAIIIVCASFPYNVVVCLIAYIPEYMVFSL